jgi:hypothetical protein
MGDLLALVRRAPGPLQTLAGAVSTWMHQERLDAVRERLADLYGYDVTSLRVPGTHAEDATEIASTAYVVVAPPDRWRIVERGHVEACDGHRAWSGTATLVTEAEAEAASLRDTGVIGICLYPGRFVGGLDFALPVEGEIEGRRCWVAEAEPQPPTEAASTAALALSGGRRLSEFVGVEHRFWFDVETGVVLRHEGSIDGELCSSIELTDVVVDRPLGSVEFGAPPGAVLRSPHELLRDHLVDLGVDPDLVDLDDPDQVRRALRGAL